MNGLIPRELMIEMLRECREQFAFYGRNHRAKAEGTLAPSKASRDDPLAKARADTLAKAQVNEEFVRRIDRLIGAPPAAKAPDNLAETEAVDQDTRRAEGGI